MEETEHVGQGWVGGNENVEEGSRHHSNANSWIGIALG